MQVQRITDASSKAEPVPLPTLFPRMPPGRSRRPSDSADPGIEIRFHVSRKARPFYSSDSDEASQNCNVPQRSPRILAVAHLRFIGIVRYREEHARRLRGAEDGNAPVSMWRVIVFSSLELEEMLTGIFGTFVALSIA